MPAPAVAIKVQLIRRDREPVFHRFRGSYSFSELSTVISHLWGERPKHSVLDYTDDEGDQVRVSSEAEWDECVRIFQGSGGAVLRLTGKRGKKVKEYYNSKCGKSHHGRKNQKGEETGSEDESGSESEQEEQEVEEVVDLADISVVSDEHLPKEEVEMTAVLSGSRVPSLPDIQRQAQQPLNMEPLDKTAAERLQASLFTSGPPCPLPTSVTSRCGDADGSSDEADLLNSDQSVNQSVNPQGGWIDHLFGTTTTRSPSPQQVKKARVPKVECNADDAVIDLLSLVYKCNAHADLSRGITHNFGPAVKRLLNPFAPEDVYLSVDRKELHDAAIKVADELIGTFQMEDVEQLLEAALIVYPAGEDRGAIEYKLGTVYSMQNRLEDSIKMLSAARRNGNDVIMHDLDNEDLKYVRTHPRFSEVVPPVFEEVPLPTTTTVVAIPTIDQPQEDAASATTGVAVAAIDERPSAFAAATQADQDWQDWHRRQTTERLQSASRERMAREEVEARRDENEAVVVPSSAIPPPVVDAQVLTLLSIFPELTADEADLALRRSEGDLGRAVNARLSGN